MLFYSNYSTIEYRVSQIVFFVKSFLYVYLQGYQIENILLKVLTKSIIYDIIVVN